MNKNDIKRILMSMRNPENEEKITNILGKVDLLTEDELEKMIIKIGDDEESIRKYLEEKLNTQQNNEHEKHTPINKMFEYGVTGGCVHLHMPVNLRGMLAEIGIKKTIDTVNLYLLDAIDRVGKLKNDGFYKLNGVEDIYMISPILVGREMKFLEELDFETHIYKKKQLQSEEFLAENSEAKLATHIFGKDANVGTAKISLATINTSEWQDKKRKKVKDFESKGIKLSKDEEIK